MQHLASSIETEKQSLRIAIALQVQQFLDQGGKITVLNISSTNSCSSRGDVWQRAVNSAALSEIADNVHA